MESGALQVIRDAGKQGILLAELVKKMNKPESTILEVIDSLSKDGHIKKIAENDDGKSTFRLIWQDSGSEWDDHEGLPCFICPGIDQCGAAQPTNPWVCEKLNKWLKDQLD